MSEFTQRLITSILGLAVLIAILVIGSWPLELAVLAVSIKICDELIHAVQMINIKINKILLFFCIFIFFISYYFPWQSSIVLGLLLALNVFYFIFREESTLEELCLSIFIFIYSTLVFLLRDMEGTSFLYLVFVVAFSTDSSAYVIGSLLGKHKLIPKVSPKKSVEGFIGGILGCLVISFLFFQIMGLESNIFHFLILACASIAGQIGDLFASKIKRQTGIKDFGAILPGHGGILDRFDSILFVTPLVHVLMQLL